ncbi:19030_t:CDS:2 [Dentiscutata erythropus]|uniref:19030_t:CDS:1 n=1 Tax=Dentiscutata erythropus TaxID=1348616 RepID=A0A9N9HXC5_9GLOM|nr:19030_t:CDS:2 [Dentiscutata erythropus]
MPSQSNEMLSYEVFTENPSHVTNCPEGEPLFQEETGKYDLDTVSVFVAKLYQLLDGDEYKEYLTWNETGDVFVICNMDEFAQNVLPKFFKHCKFTSFVRQLNIYGFYRVSDARKSKHVRSKHACVFSHSQFRRGRQDLLPNIRRKVSKTIRRKPRLSDSSMSQNQGESGPTSSSSVYGSPVNGKSGNIKDSPSHSTLNPFTDSKDFVDRSDNDLAMRKRIAELTMTTENLRKDLKHMNSIVNDRLIPEVRNLTEDLQKHHAHVIQLTQLVYHTSPESIQLLQEVSRGFTRPLSSSQPDIPSSKRMRYDDKQTTSVKSEQSNLTPSSVQNVPTVPSSIPSNYGVYATHQNHPGNNLMSGNDSSITGSSMQSTPPVSQSLAMSPDSHSAYNMSGSSIIGEYQHSPHSAHPGLTGFNEHWNTPVLIQESVNTVPSSNMSSFLFPTTTTSHPPLMFNSSSPHQQQSPPHSQQHSPASSIGSLSPTEYVSNTSTVNTNDIISNVVASTNSNDNHNSGENSPHHHGDVIVAVSPSSTTSSSPISTSATMPNYYQSNSIIPLEIYNPSYENYN